MDDLSAHPPAGADITQLGDISGTSCESRFLVFAAAPGVVPNAERDALGVNADAATASCADVGGVAAGPVAGDGAAPAAVSSAEGGAGADADTTALPCFNPHSALLRSVSQGCCSTCFSHASFPALD